MRNGAWERKKNITEEELLVEKWHFSIGFDAVLKLKTEENWFLGAKKNIIEEKYLVGKWHFTFGFDAVLRLKIDEKWSDRSEKIYSRGKKFGQKMTLRLVLMLF